MSHYERKLRRIFVTAGAVAASGGGEKGAVTTHETPPDSLPHTSLTLSDFPTIETAYTCATLKT